MNSRYMAYAHVYVYTCAMHENSVEYIIILLYTCVRNIQCHACIWL